MLLQENQSKTLPRRLRGASWVRKSVAGLVLGSVLGSGAAAAHAAFYSSSVGQFTGAGRTYNTQAVLNTDSSPDLASTFVSVQGGPAPAGWLGSQARTFLENGAFCGEGSFYYSSSATSTTSSNLGMGCGAQRYFSWGVTKGWNGNGYNTVYTFRTPVGYATNSF